MPSIKDCPCQQPKLRHPYQRAERKLAKANVPILDGPPPFVRAVLSIAKPGEGVSNSASLPFVFAEFQAPAPLSYFQTITCCPQFCNLSMEELRLADTFALAGIATEAELCEGRGIAPSTHALEILNEKRSQDRIAKGNGFDGHRLWETEALVTSTLHGARLMLSPTAPSLGSSNALGDSMLSGGSDPDAPENSMCEPFLQALTETRNHPDDSSTTELSNVSIIEPSTYSASLSANTMSTAITTFGEPDVGLSTAEEDWEEAKRDLVLRKSALDKAQDEYDTAANIETAKFWRYSTLRLVSK
ncbi:hypothetical protein FRB94_013259 [Tulasnella sp. JGI-2019a]|nr:hypothetical protein FRB93_001965 [Tulasnella sp. JGI-2019a]KAG9008435.1 hypothetical protein FRB94_013259 [Tulasnella sp. JGI-2019a]KAG9031440.1 hypothetical protein FRB95_002740 [Tulasnella sp. JGI-2019a]